MVNRFQIIIVFLYSWEELSELVPVYGALRQNLALGPPKTPTYSMTAAIDSDSSGVNLI